VCHMSAPFGDLAGGHSMRISYMEEGEEAEHTTGCTISGCHSSTGFSLDYNGKMTEVEHNMDTLKILLAQRNWIDTVANGVKPVHHHLLLLHQQTKPVRYGIISLLNMIRVKVFIIRIMLWQFSVRQSKSFENHKFGLF